MKKNFYRKLFFVFPIGSIPGIRPVRIFLLASFLVYGTHSFAQTISLQHDLERNALTEKQTGDILAGNRNRTGLLQNAGYSSNVRETMPAVSSANQSVQQQLVKGIVVDASNQEGLPGVNVVVKGSAIGAVTNINGEYSLEVPGPESVLVFSFIGYLSQEITVNDKSIINVSLEQDVAQLDEMVVVGYGSVKKNNFTGAVAQVKSKEFERVPAVNPLTALQGRAPGLRIVSNSGEPGAGSSISIRGDQSISGTNSPIFVVDGSITASIDNISSQDIESISVLKDASAVAIYGSRAANGVIVVTTKRGAGSRKPVISLHTYTGIQQPGNLDLELLNAEEWLDIYTEAFENSGITPTWTDADLANYQGVDTDWLDVIRRTGTLSNVDLSVAGSSERSNYYVSTGFIKNKGIVEGQSYDRFNLRLNTDHRITDWITFGNSINIFSSNTRGSVLPYQTALMKVPLTRVYEENGDWGIIRNTTLEHSYANPLWTAKNTVHDQAQKGLIGNLYLTLSLLKGLQFTARGSLDWTNDYRSNFAPGADPAWQWETTTINSVGKDNREIQHWVSDFLLNYNRSFGEDHQVSALLGYSLEEQTYERLWSSGTGTPTNSLRYLNSANPTSIVSDNTFTDWAFESMFGRIGYTFRDKYILGATVRRDGTSRLDAAHRYGTFPSVSAAWRITEESFLKKADWLNELKMRASWGTVGNVLSIGTYGTQASLTNWNYARNEDIAQGYTLATAVNKDLVWESTEKKNFGLDFELLSNKIYGSADFFIEDTRDLLFAQPIPNSAGLVGNPFVNAGHIQNRGIELDLGYRYMSTNWRYSVSGNLTKAKNEVMDLEGRDLETSGIVEGHPLRSYYGYISNGLIRTEEDLTNAPHLEGKGIGDIWLVDTNNDGVLNADDRTILASRYPDLTYGLMAMAGYKGLTLQVQVQGVQGVTRDIRIGGDLGQMHYFTSFPKNHDRLILDRFHPTRNPDGEFPKVAIDDKGNNLNVLSDFWLYDASYLRVSNVNLNYDFPTSFIQRVGVGGLGVYASVQNLYTITNFYGPEVDTNANVLEGVPQPRTWIFGLRVSF